MVGTLRAWNVKAAVGDVKDVWEAVVSVWRRRDWAGVGLCGGCGCGSGWDDKGELVGDVSLSFVDAIWVSNDARRRRSSAEG
jgi:hypothetical protein